MSYSRHFLSGAVFLFLQAAAPLVPGDELYVGYNVDPPPPDRSGMENNAVEIAGRIRAGWNIGNTLEAIGAETNWGNPLVSRKLIQLVKKNGFNAIRIPCSWQQYAEPKTAKISEKWLSRVREVVRYCVDEDLYVILNIHWDGGWLENNVTPGEQAADNAKQKAFWEQIAVALRDFDGHLLFAGANEPHVEDAVGMKTLLSLHQTFIDAVRSTGGRNAYRVLVVQGPKTDIETTSRLMNDLPVDTVPDRLMVEVHCYTPFNFTLMTKDRHWGRQFYYWGEGYHSETDTDRNATWAEEAELERLFGLMKTKFVEEGIPVVLGEFGVSRRTALEESAQKLHLASRIHYLDYVTERAAANGLLPFYWDNGALGHNSLGIFDRRAYTVYDPQVVAALTQIEAELYWQRRDRELAGTEDGTEDGIEAESRDL